MQKDLLGRFTKARLMIYCPSKMKNTKTKKFEDIIELSVNVPSPAKYTLPSKGVTFYEKNCS